MLNLFLKYLLKKYIPKESTQKRTSSGFSKIESLKKIELLVNQTIKDYAIREKYDLILYENVAFVSDDVNITQDIIDEIEKL